MKSFFKIYHILWISLICSHHHISISMQDTYSTSTMPLATKQRIMPLLHSFMALMNQPMPTLCVDEIIHHIDHHFYPLTAHNIEQLIRPKNIFSNIFHYYSVLPLHLTTQPITTPIQKNLC